MSLRARLTTPTPTGITAAQVAKDVSLYGGIVVSIAEVLANAGLFSVPGGFQGVVSAVVAVVTALFSVRAQQTAAAAAHAAASVRR